MIFEQRAHYKIKQFHSPSVCKFINAKMMEKISFTFWISIDSSHRFIPSKRQGLGSNWLVSFEVNGLWEVIKTKLIRTLFIRLGSFLKNASSVMNSSLIMSTILIKRKQLLISKWLTFVVRCVTTLTKTQIR